MGFKKSNWIKYSSDGEIVEIIIREASGAKIESFKCNNKKDYGKIIHIIKKKYGFMPYYKESKDKEIIEEKNWLEKDWSWRDEG